MLAKYLGEDKMLAVVCRSLETANALEAYQENGEVDHMFGLHAEAAALGKSIHGGFDVICLEEIRYNNSLLVAILFQLSFFPLPLVC